MVVWYWECNFIAKYNRKKSRDTHPNQRILCVANSSEGAEVENEGELSIVQRKGERRKSRMLDTWAETAIVGRIHTTGFQR